MPPCSEDAQSSAGPPAAVPPCHGSTLPVFDVGVLRALVGDDPDLLDELLADYLAGARRQRLALRDACAIRAFTDARMLAHNLKSSSRSVGALALGAACQGLENAALGCDADAVVEWMGKLVAELELAERSIEAALPTGCRSSGREPS